MKPNFFIDIFKNTLIYILLEIMAKKHCEMMDRFCIKYIIPVKLNRNNNPKNRYMWIKENFFNKNY